MVAIPAYRCSHCAINWPSDPAYYVKWEDDRNYRNVCARCLGPVDYYPTKSCIRASEAKEIAGQAEWERREKDYAEHPAEGWEKELHSTADGLMETLAEIRALSETPHPLGLE